jgi:hypothetical protein
LQSKIQALLDKAVVRMVAARCKALLRFLKVTGELPEAQQALEALVAE